LLSLLLVVVLVVVLVARQGRAMFAVELPTKLVSEATVGAIVACAKQWLGVGSSSTVTVKTKAAYVNAAVAVAVAATVRD